MPSYRRLALALLLSIAWAGPAHADRRYFVHSYTPYLATAGSLELEAGSFAAYGRGDSVATAWHNHLEFEYGITDRLTGAAYLNFVQTADPNAASRFDGPSLELIYRLAEPGRLPVDPAVYVEVRENGDEFEIEPKLLLALRYYRLVSVLNIAGEFERHFSGDDRGITEKNLRVTAGLAREFGHVVAFGVEAVYERPGFTSDPATSALYVGPSVNLQTPRVQMALGWQPQVSGHPATTRGLNLHAFPRSEVRLIIGVDL